MKLVQTVPSVINRLQTLGPAKLQSPLDMPTCLQPVPRLLWTAALAALHQMAQGFVTNFSVMMILLAGVWTATHRGKTAQIRPSQQILKEQGHAKRQILENQETQPNMKIQPQTMPTFLYVSKKVNE